MATNDIGRVTPIWRGFYSAATTYELNDIVIDTAGSVWWHKSEEQTTGVTPAVGDFWDAVIDMSIFSGLIQTAIVTAQTAVQAAQAAETGVAEDVQRAETAAGNAETYAQNAQTSAANVGAYAQAAEAAKNAAAGSAESAGSSATAAAGSKSDAEAYAVGKRGGTDVGVDDPTYHNNAKYYADQAGSSAEAAAGSKSDAEAYAVGKRGGEDVGSEDPAYHNNAKYWSEQAEATAEDIEDSSAQIAQNAADVADLKTQITDAFGFADNIKFVSFTKGAYINCAPSGTTVIDLTPIPTASVSYAIIECSEREPIVLNGKGYYNGRLWCFIDSDNNRLSAASTSVEANNLVIRAPKNAAKCIINVQNSTMGPCFYGGFLEDKENISAIEHTLGLNNIENPIETNIKYLTESTARGITFTPKTWNTIHVQGTTEASYDSICYIFDNKTGFPAWLEKGKKYNVKLFANDGNINFNVYYYDSNENLTNILRMGNPNLQHYFVVPYNAVGLRIALHAVRGSHVLNEDVSVFITEEKTLKELKAETPRNNIKALFANNNMVDIAHRGFSQMYPENTTLAFNAAATYGYKFIECDLQKCLDGYVIIHDGTIDRTTSGTGNVAEMTIAQIQSYDITHWSQITQKVPALAEALQCFSMNGLIPVIELKKETIEVADIPDILSILDAWGGKYIITSLEHGFRSDGNAHKKLLEAVRNYSEEIPISVCLWEACTEDIVDGIYNVFGMNTTMQVWENTEPTQAIINYVHSKGLTIGTFTPSTYQRYYELMELGFDSCTSNYLMNNHQITGQCVAQVITNDTFTEKAIILSGVDAYDVIWIRGYIKTTNSVYIQMNTQDYYKLKLESNDEFKYVNIQLWPRGSMEQTVNIFTDNGTDEITSKFLTILKTKMLY